MAKIAFLDGVGNQTTLDGLSRAVTDKYISSGISTAGDLLVTEDATPAKKVKIGLGSALIGVDVYTGSQNKFYYLFADATETVDVTSNASGNPRTDAVVAYVDTSASGTGDNPGAGVFAVVAGTPAASPTAPSDADIQTSLGSSIRWIRLANVEVANGFTTIIDANVINSGVVAKLNDMYLGEGKAIVGTTAAGTYKTILALDSDITYVGNSGYNSIFRGVTHTFWDTSGNIIAKFLAGIASAVNYVTFTNASAHTGAPDVGDPTISVAGSDTNIDLAIKGKGAGQVLVHLANDSYAGNPAVSGPANTDWFTVTGVSSTVYTRKASKVMVMVTMEMTMQTNYSDYRWMLRIIESGSGTTVGKEWNFNPAQSALNFTTSVHGVYTSTTAETLTFTVQMKRYDGSVALTGVNATMFALVIPD